MTTQGTTANAPRRPVGWTMTFWTAGAAACLVTLAAAGWLTMRSAGALLPVAGAESMRVVSNVGAVAGIVAFAWAIILPVYGPRGSWLARARRGFWALAMAFVFISALLAVLALPSPTESWSAWGVLGVLLTVPFAVWSASMALLPSEAWSHARAIPVLTGAVLTAALVVALLCTSIFLVFTAMSSPWKAQYEDDGSMLVELIYLGPHPDDGLRAERWWRDGLIYRPFDSSWRPLE